MCAWFKLLPDSQQIAQVPFVKTLEKIQRRVENQGKIRISPEKEFFVPEYKSPDKKKYLQDLQEQIKEAKTKNSEEKVSRRAPWISNNFSPFPNRQTTPKDERRLREKSKMNLFKQHLDKQLVEKSVLDDRKKLQEHQRVRSIIEQDVSDFHDFEKKRMEKEKSERVTLTESWGLVLTSKQKSLNQILGERSLSPQRGRNFFDEGKSRRENGEENSKKIILDQRIENILNTVRKGYHQKNFSSQFKSTNQIIKGGRKHFNLE
jgi:hypothetical protein